MAGVVVVCLACPLRAIDPGRMLSQYMREQWGSERGFTGGAVTAIAQTSDGYLWIGTEKGLIRFDGLNFRLYQQAVPTPLADRQRSGAGGGQSGKPVGSVAKYEDIAVSRRKI